jgi:histidine ammonia-lyase
VFLSQALNAKVVPAFSSETSCGIELCAFLTGLQVTCYTPHGKAPSTTALFQVKLKPLPLSKAEVKVLSSDSLYSLAIAGLVAAGSLNLLSSIDCIAALSCEAGGADISHFDVAIFENIRQQRGQINSSNSLRNLLEGSKRVTTSCGVKAFAIIPQVHGPAIEMISSSAK